MEVYLDHAATTRMDPRVLEEMLPYLRERFGNASTLYSLGVEGREAIDEARERIASAINADPEEIVFTSGGTEGDNLAIKGIAYANMKRGKHIVTSAIEHHAVLNPCRWLAAHGFEVTYLTVDENGLVDPEEVEKAIRTDTILVSVMHANNEIGTIEPIDEIGEIARGHGVYFHTDAVQSLGKLPINVERKEIDLLTISSHKIYGPKGVGALYVRQGTQIEALLHGGGHEGGIRSGTENVPGIIGFGKAIELAVEEMKKEPSRELKLRDRIIRELSGLENSKLNGHPVKRLPNNVNFSFPGVDGEAIVLELNDRGIYASTGSACSAASDEPSHVLTAIGLAPYEARGSLRLTLGMENTVEEIEYALEVIPEVITKLRRVSRAIPIDRKPD